MRSEFRVKTREQTQLLDINAEVRQVVEQAAVQEGFCVVFVPHTTAGVTINENADPSVVRDILMYLNKIVPFDDGYTHREGNSAAHIKASLMGSSVTLIISGGRLMLGTWQGIYFCEFDGPRNRSVQVQIIGSKT